MAGLVGPQLPEQLPGGGQGTPQSCRRGIGQLRARAVAAAGLVDDRRDDGGQLGRRQGAPRARAQALGNEQVAFAVDPGQQPAVVGRPYVGSVGAAGNDISALGEQADDAVERTGQRVGHGRDLLAQLGIVALHPQITLAGPGQGLAVGDGVGRVAAHLLAQRHQLGIDIGVAATGPSATLARHRNHQSGPRGPQRRGKVTAHPRLTVLYPLRQRHRPDPSRRTRVVRRRDAAGPAVLSEHQRPGVLVVGGGFQHDGQAAALAGGDVDDVAAPQRGQCLTGRPTSL